MDDPYADDPLLQRSRRVRESLARAMEESRRIIEECRRLREDSIDVVRRCRSAVDMPPRDQRA